MRKVRACTCCDESAAVFHVMVGEWQGVCDACLDAGCSGNTCLKPQELGEPLPTPVRRTETGVLIVDEDAMVSPETWLTTQALGELAAKR